MPEEMRENVIRLTCAMEQLTKAIAGLNQEFDAVRDGPVRELLQAVARHTERIDSLETNVTRLDRMLWVSLGTVTTTAFAVLVQILMVFIK